MKNTVKRLLAALMTASMMTAALTGCGDKTDTATKSDAAASAEDTAEMGPVMSRIKETGKMVIATASGYMPYEFIDITSPNQEVIGVDMALGDKIVEKLSEKLGISVEKQIEDTTFTANLAAVAADQVDIMIAGMSPTEERKQNMDFSDVYLKMPTSIRIWPLLTARPSPYRRTPRRRRLPPTC